MVQDVGGRDMEWRPVKSGSPWKYVDVGGYSSGGLRFRHILSPDYSGLFAFLGPVKRASEAGPFKGVSECPLCLLHVWLQRLALP